MLSSLPARKQHGLILSFDDTSAFKAWYKIEKGRQGVLSTNQQFKLKLKKLSLFQLRM